MTFLPGDHVEGSVKISSLLCRVNVAKTLTICSKGRAFRGATDFNGNVAAEKAEAAANGKNDVGGARLFAFSHETGLTIILR